MTTRKQEIEAQIEAITMTGMYKIDGKNWHVKEEGERLYIAVAAPFANRIWYLATEEQINKLKEVKGK